jgi:hypothetical protein
VAEQRNTYKIINLKEETTRDTYALFGVDWIQLSQDRVQWPVLVNRITNLRAL